MSVAAVAPAATTGATSTTTTGTSATTRPTAPTRAGRLRIRDLDGDPAAVELTAVQLRDRVLSLLRRGHLDEPEATRLARESIGEHGRGHDVAWLRKARAQPVRGRGAP